MSRSFKMQAVNFERCVLKFISPIADKLYDTLMKTVESEYTMNKLKESGKAFENFKFARYSTLQMLHFSNSIGLQEMSKKEKYISVGNINYMGTKLKFHYYRVV